MRLFLFLLCLPILSWGYVSQKDVVYDVVDGRELKLDIFSPRFHLLHAPVLFYIHGGCFNAGSKNDIPESAKKMADEGFVVVSVGYRLSNVAKYPAAVKDVQAAVRFMRKHSMRYRVNPNRMASFGHSAGGYLASVLGVRAITDREGKTDKYSQRVQKVADWYGRTNFTLPQNEGFDCAQDFLGKPRNAQTMSAFEEASIAPYVNEKSAEFYIVHGTADKQVFPIHSRELYDELSKYQRSPHLLWIKNAGHGFVDGPGWIKTKDFLLDL